MRKTITTFAAVLTLSIGVAGCANMPSLGQIETGISLATKSVANPVTKNEEAQVELLIDTALKGLLAYRRACVDGAADKNCRLNIAQIQPYTRQIPPLRDQLRTFVDNDDQLNASVVYNQLSALYKNIKQSAADLGINLGSSK